MPISSDIAFTGLPPIALQPARNFSLRSNFLLAFSYPLSFRSGIMILDEHLCSSFVSVLASRFPIQKTL
jgi:ABC-type polysaccharide/polyol phosphate transport system ATPase subunit